MNFFIQPMQADAFSAPTFIPLIKDFNYPSLFNDRVSVSHLI